MEQIFNPIITAIQLQVGRTSAGLGIDVKASTKIEDFFKNVSGGVIDPIDLRVNGRFWHVKNDINILNFYSISSEAALIGIIPLNDPNFVGYRLDAPSRQIIQNDRDGRGNVVNISFLRYVDISKEGLNITIKGVYSENQVRMIHNSILKASQAFCESFLSPINLAVNLIEY